MAKLFQEIAVKVERRQVAILTPDGSERLGFFHKWSPFQGGVDWALVENADGTMSHIRANYIRFLPIGNEISNVELEEIYRENGILQGCRFKAVNEKPDFDPDDFMGEYEEEND